MIPINKRKIGVCILLSIVTFGIYQIYWEYLLVINTRTIQKDESNCTGEMLCLLFVPFYSLFWWFTRGKIVKDKFAEHSYSTIDSEIAYLVLGIFGLAIVSMAIMQNDFNSLKSESTHSIQRSAFFSVQSLLSVLLFGIEDSHRHIGQSRTPQLTGFLHFCPRTERGIVFIKRDIV